MNETTTTPSTDLPPLTELQERQLLHWFVYHPPTQGDTERYSAINEAARHLARVIMETCPNCEDQWAALRLVRSARMTANSAIACKGV